MKKNIVIILIIAVSFLFIPYAQAAETKAWAYITSGGNVRTGPGTHNSKYANAYAGSYYPLVEDKTYTDTNNHNGCSTDWYQIYYSGSKKAYICGEHVKVVRGYKNDSEKPTTACEQKLSAAGFPSSYWGGLCNMQDKHPTWQFVPLKTNTDWKSAVEAESPCGWNLVYDNETNASFIDKTCTAHDGPYIGVSTSAVVYYMDPRNFFNERSIFQFHHLAYDEKFATFYDKGVTSLISNAEFYKYHINKEPSVNLATEIVIASHETEMSPIFTATRILQELGSKDTEEELYSGVYEGYEKKYYGYYNFYNFGVSTSCNNQYGRTYCGLDYAYRNNWYGINAAIKGGVSQIANNYVKQNQYTGYMQKFNVLGSGVYNKYSHQYMTNIQGAYSEANTTYNTYSNLGILDTAFIFYIPVFNNMNVEIANDNNGAVDTGDGEASTMPISTIVTSSGYRYASGYISKINVGLTVNELKDDLEAVSGTKTVTIKNGSGAVVYDGTLGTGYKVIISNKDTTEELSVVIKGDTSGDGKINALDLLQVQKSILGTYTLSGAYKQAGDTSGDGAVNALDLLQVQKNILGTYKIVQ